MRRPSAPTAEIRGRPAGGNREALGFLASLAFTGMAAGRDVYFGGLFQRLNPLVVAVIAFTLCSVVFLPLAWVKSPGSFTRLARRPREVVWINATTASAWLPAATMTWPAC